MDGGDDQVALVLAVVVVGDDDDLAAGEGVDGFANAGSATRALFSEPVFARGSPGLPSRSFNIVSRHNIARAFRPRESHRSNAPMRRSAAKRRRVARLGTAGILRPACGRDAGGSVKISEQPPLFPVPARRRPRPRARRSPSRSRRAAARDAAPAAAAAGCAPADVRARAPAGRRRSGRSRMRQPSPAPRERGPRACPRRVRVPAIGWPPAHPSPLPWGAGAPVRVEQHQQFEVAFGGAAADDRGDEVARALDQIAVALLQRDDGPADIRQHFPEPHPLRVETPPRRRLVSPIERVALGDAAGLAIEPREAPALAAEPADILVRIAPAGEFPIEDRRSVRPPGRKSSM